MKVQEIIISESELPEGWGSALGSALSALSKPVSRTLGRLFGTERQELVDLIAKRMSGKGKWANAASVEEAEKEASRLGVKAANAVKADKSILDDAVKQANKVRDPSKISKAAGTTGKTIKGTASGALKIPKVAYKLTQIGLTAAMVDAVMAPISEYYKFMEIADQWLDSGEIPPQFKGQFNSVEEWYKKYREEQLTKTISKVSVALAAISFAELPVGVVGGLLSFFRLGKSASLIRTVGLAGGALLAQAVKDSEISNGLANLLANDVGGLLPTSGIIGGVSAEALDSKLGKVLSTIGHAGVGTYNVGRGAYDKVAGNNTSPQPSEPAADAAKPAAANGQSTKPPAEKNVDAKADKDATSSKPSTTEKPAVNRTATGYELAPNASPIDKWIDVGGGYVKDPVTGQIANRYSLGLN